MYLEILIDLTALGFISYLKRFLTCFEEENRERNSLIILKHCQKLFMLVKFPDELLSGYLSFERIELKFILLKASSFDGLWEAGVKLFKHHLELVADDTKLNIEYILIIVAQIKSFL